MSTTELPLSLAEALQGKRLVFTISTGRSGTKYLARMLRLLPDVSANHEPHPRFSEVTPGLRTDPDAARRFWVDQKLPAIAAHVQPVYMETSHLFCKGFVEPLLAFGFRPDLIVLRRSYRQVARSLYRLAAIPGRNPEVDPWYLRPDDRDVLPIPGWEALHDYQLCYWYCLEIERRTVHYLNLWQGFDARVHETTLDAVATGAGFNALRRALDLPKLPLRKKLAYWRRKGLSFNKKLEAKASQSVAALSDEELDDLEAEVERLVG